MLPEGDQKGLFVINHFIQCFYSALELVKKRRGKALRVLNIRPSCHQDRLLDRHFLLNGQKTAKNASLDATVAKYG